MNLVLIGMPACGKSTAGVITAKLLGYRFTDTDLIIQQREGRLLQQIIDESGTDALLKAEEAALLSVSSDNEVIATGGSAVYSEAGMKHLQKNAVVAYIEVPFEDIKERLDNLDTRGVAGAENKTLAEIFAEREPLYKKYADITVGAHNTDPYRTAERLAELFRSFKKR